MNEPPRRHKFGIQNAVDAHVLRVKTGVLCVEIIYGVAKTVDYLHDIHALPEKMRRIEIGADNGTDGFSQAQQRLGIINAETGAFQAQSADAVLDANLTAFFQ